MRQTRKQLYKKHQTRKKSAAWGYHLIIDAAGCHPEAIRSKSIIKEFVQTLVKEIKMVAFGPPRIVKFGCGRTKGFTLVQLIQTSDITAHFVETTNDIYFDLFSCKSFDPAIVTHLFNLYFEPRHKKIKFLKRQA